MIKMINIRARRKELNMTQEQLADKLFVTVQAISQWENGKTEPDYDKLLKLPTPKRCAEP